LLFYHAATLDFLRLLPPPLRSPLLFLFAAADLPLYSPDIRCDDFDDYFSPMRLFRFICYAMRLFMPMPCRFARAMPDAAAAASLRYTHATMFRHG